MKFTIYQESRIGRRKSNQDRIAYCYTRDALLLVLADGMGGHLHGEIAAQITVQFVAQAFQREAQPMLQDPSMFLSRALTNAHNAILDYAFDKDLPEAPRTTVVACVLQEGHAHWAHAGDSRLYLLRGGKIVSQTRDHSRVQLMMDQGLLDAQSAARHPGRNRIYSCLGGNHPPQVEFSARIPLRDNDTIALCSDGLWGPLGDTGVLLGLTDQFVQEAVPRLMDKAEELGGPSCDNLSLIAVRWHDDSAPLSADGVSTQTMTLNDFTTQLETFDQSRSPTTAPDLTDDEIERAIAEINAAIQKFSK
ncbi:PP2C family protein-serine/threonine phosphatase [Pseudothauera rhizosphaerae]|uniref:Serine/threonine-protein phosphatase n=1 Tax=Pseudothauera rhizosphaerae TaxID=2565932 RepID=A0A4S4ALK4_9RHOO|nr:PP2C family serine/threonine-protein phosphatase [Pseudothauera rhizosphaerae]THF60394.1 serine/threonine-protein phosphatase [Pseudothauera rhizosphaerae]